MLHGNVIVSLELERHIVKRRGIHVILDAASHHRRTIWLTVHSIVEIDLGPVNNGLHDDATLA